MDIGHVTASDDTDTRSTMTPGRRVVCVATLAVLMAAVSACSPSEASAPDATGPPVTVATTAATATSAAATVEMSGATTDMAGEDEVAGPSGSTDATGTTTSVVTPEGYDLVAATVTTAAGEECDVCLWLADTAPRRSQGLMGVTDLGDGDGMAFVYPAPHTGSFWMRNTLLPLSIAFFGDDGRYLGDFEMEPCTADPCRLYPTAPDFTVAIETTRGDLDALGIGPGSRLSLSNVVCGA